MHGHNIHSLATVNYQLRRGETLFHLPLTNVLEISKDSSTTTRKYSKTFFACKFVLAANYQLYSGNIQRLSGQQSATTINSNNQQQQSTAATSSNNQQQQSTAATSNSNQQQQSTAAINSSNQQQQSTAAISSSNQQQHSTTTINCSNNQLSTYQHHLHNPRRPTLDTITVPSSVYVLLEVDLGLATRLRVHLPPLPRFIFVTFRFF